MKNKGVISVIVATDEDWGIGKDNDLLYPISADLKRFKCLTTGHTVVMGRKTFDSLPGGALPNRRNIVISSNKEFRPEGCEVVHSFEEVMSLLKGESFFVIGGGSVYKHFLPFADELYLTKIHASLGADTFFPVLDATEWTVIKDEQINDDTRSRYAYSFIDLKRVDCALRNG